MFKASREEYETKIEMIHKLMEKRGLGSVYVSNHVFFLYFSGISYLPTETGRANHHEEGQIYFFVLAVEKYHVRAQKIAEWANSVKH